MGKIQYRIINTGKGKLQLSPNDLHKVASSSEINYVYNGSGTVWDIVHNLGKTPAVTILDSSGYEVKTSVKHVDNNRLIITFKKSFSGKAILN